MKRWVNIRDAYNKSIKREKILNKSGSADIITKQYVYADQLKFLHKIFSPRSTGDNLSIKNEDSETTPSGSDNKNKNAQVKISHVKQHVGFRKRKHDDIELNMINPLEQPEDRHLSFFKGIIPTINTLSEDEVLTFQMGVLQLLNNIKQSRNLIDLPNVNTQSPAPLTCYISPQKNMTKNRNSLTYTKTSKNSNETSACESYKLFEDPSQEDCVYVHRC